MVSLNRTKTMKHIKHISCQTCIKRHYCEGDAPDPECYQGKQTSTMEEKIRQREEIAKFRKKMAKLYNL